MSQNFNVTKPPFNGALLSVDMRNNFAALISSNSGNAAPSAPGDGMWWLRPLTNELWYRINGGWKLFATYDTGNNKWIFSGASSEVYVTAGEDLNGGRAIFVDADGLAYKADKSVLAEVRGIIGITPGAIMTGDSGPVIVAGEITEGTWAWTPNTPLFCNSDGILTQTAATSGYLRKVATAISATKIVIGLGETIALA